jgi:hypothetical protein
LRRPDWSVAAVDRTAQGQTSQAFRALESCSARDSRCGRPRVALAVSGHPVVVSSQPESEVPSVDLLVEPSARRPKPSRTSWCWKPQRKVPADRGAPPARGSRWTRAPPTPPANRRPAGSWAPRQLLARTGAQRPAAEHRDYGSQKDARWARTPARPPRLPCSHRRRGAVAAGPLEGATDQFG